MRGKFGKHHGEQPQNSGCIVIPTSCYALLWMMIALTGCSTYSSKFICPDAKGLNCEMLHSIDQKINTGGIEEFYQCSSNSHCLGKKRL